MSLNIVSKFLAQVYKEISLKKYFVVINAIFCSLFFLLLFLGHYTKSLELLYFVNILKYLFIVSMSLCIYEYYRTKSKSIFFIFLISLILVWLVGFDFAYRWDAIQHVARAKYYLSHEFIGSSERKSIAYLIWGIVYRLFGESEIVTHLTNMFLGLIGIFGIYKISNELYDRFTAFVAILVSFTLPLFFIVNKWAYLDMPFVSFVIITFFFFLKYLNTERRKYLCLALIFAFLSTSAKMPGLMVFPTMFLCLFVYKKMDIKNFSLVAVGTLFSSFYVFYIMASMTVVGKLMQAQIELSIISPFSFGKDCIFLWLGLFNQQIQQLLCSGMFILSMLSFLKIKKKDSVAIYAILVAQIALFIINLYFPTKYKYYFPLFPLNNYLPQLLLLGSLISFLILYHIYKKLETNFGKKELFLSIWIISFMLFFVINGKVYGYGWKPILDVSLLDFRYLMPAFPALIILFSSGVSKVLKSDCSKYLKYLSILIVASILMFNVITATNLVFYYANSGNTHLQGYEEVRKLGATIVYTHWPFYHAPEGKIYDLGDFKWKRDNIKVHNIHSYISSKNGYFLFDSHFYSPKNLINFEIMKFDSKTYNLNPLFYGITEETVDHVYIAKVPDIPILAKKGFHNVEKWGNIPTRWTSNNATISIYSIENRDSNLSFNVVGFYTPRNLQVYLNDELIHEQKIPTSFVEVEIPVKLKEGENILRFYTPDGCQRPCDIPELKNKDSRCLSLAFQNIALTPVKKNYDVDFTDYSIPDLMAVNSFYSSNITIKNVGTEKWNKNGVYPVYVSYHWLKDGKVVLWDGIRNKLPCDVTSGNAIEMNMNIEAPHEEGNYTLIIDLVKECVTWFETQGAVPLKKNVTISRYGLKQISRLEYQTEYTEVNELKKLIESALDSSATSFDGKSGRVHGFYAGSGYPQIWVRDSATIIPVARYLYPDEFIRAWIEEFLINQAENGSIYDYITLRGGDKNTVETDQETSLVHSSYQYYKISGNKSWLLTEIDGKTIIARLDDSLRYVLKFRYNSTYGLVTGAYTADWGDVQFEDSPGTDITNKTHWTCDIYDNAMFYRACEELSMIYSELGDKGSAAFWSGIAQSIEENANKCLWQPDKRFYKMHVYLTPPNLDFTESDMFPMGGNAMAVRVGLANHTQASQIFKVAEEKKKEANATTIGCVLYPPYPDGFFANPIMDEEHEYQNGGQWDWFAGRLILAEFENGFSEDAVLHLKEISKQDISAGGLYEWYTLNGTGKGSSNYTGSAGVLGESIIEGYFGVYLSHNNLEIKPRLCNSNGSIYLYEPATDVWVSYNYSSFQNNTMILKYESNFPKSDKISVLVPDGKTVSKISIDNTSVQYNIDKIGNDTYVSFISDFKQHECGIFFA